MAMTTNEAQLPVIFNEIIRRRVSDYIDGELTALIRQKVDSIITDVLADIQTDSQLLRDMLHHETKLVVRAIYKGEEVEQKGKGDGK